MKLAVMARSIMAVVIVLGAHAASAQNPVATQPSVIGETTTPKTFRSVFENDSDPETADIPVVIISMLDEATRGMALGAVDFHGVVAEARTLVASVAEALHDQAELGLAAPTLVDVEAVVTDVPDRDVLEVDRATRGICRTFG